MNTDKIVSLVTHGVCPECLNMPPVDYCSCCYKRYDIKLKRTVTKQEDYDR